MKNKEIKQRKFRPAFGAIIGLTTATTALAAGALAVSLTRKYTWDQKVEVESEVIEAETIGGIGSCTIHLTEQTLDSKISISIANDASSKTKVLLYEDSSEFELDENNKCTFWVSLDDLPTESVAPHFNIVVTYKNKNNNQRTLVSNPVTLNYAYEGPQVIDVNNPDLSKVKQAEQEVVTSEEDINDKYFEAVEKDPSIFFNDLAFGTDSFIKLLLNVLPISVFKDYQFYGSDLKVEKETQNSSNTYYLSFKIQRVYSVQPLSIISPTYTMDSTICTHIPFKIFEPSKTNNAFGSRMWAIEIVKDKWVDNTSIVSYGSTSWSEYSPAKKIEYTDIKTYTDYENEGIGASLYVPEVKETFLTATAQILYSVWSQYKDFGFAWTAPRAKCYLGQCASGFNNVTYVNNVEDIKLDDINEKIISYKDSDLFVRFTVDEEFESESEVKVVGKIMDGNDVILESENKMVLTAGDETFVYFTNLQDCMDKIKSATDLKIVLDIAE